MPKNRQLPNGAGLDTSLLPFQTSSSDRLMCTNCFVPLWAVPPVEMEAARGGAAGNPRTTVLTDRLGDLQSQLKLSFGVAFLDQTRIRPQGSLCGDQLLSLSLAAGDKVMIEQQRVSKQEVTYEEPNEAEQQVDLQFGTTLTTGTDEGLDRKRNNPSSTDSSLKPDVTIPVSGVSITVADSTRNSVTNADAASQKRTPKQPQTSSSKVTSNYRSLPKTTPRVAAAQTFQTSNKRILRNLNPYTPLHLRHFKIYRPVQLCLGRFGVRRAGAPCVGSFAATVLDWDRANVTSYPGWWSDSL
jgi:hypothetical protein